MWKRILLVTLILGLGGVLVAGGIIRTMDRTSLVAEAQSRGRGQNHRGVDETSGAGYGVSGGGRGMGSEYGPAGGGRGAVSHDESGSSDRGEGANYGPGGQGRGNGRGIWSDADRTDTHRWETLQGSVVTVNEDALLVQTDDGAQIAVEGRSWQFAQEKEFWVQLNDEVTVLGFYEGEEFRASRIDDITSGQSVLLRNGDGRPMWAGRGRYGF
jgi:hypothetical protein